MEGPQRAEPGHLIQLSRKQTLCKELFQAPEKRLRALLTVSATVPMITPSEEATLDRVPCIWYPVQF